MTSRRTLTVAEERFPIAGRFVISRGARTEAVVLVASISEGAAAGRGECVPYKRYDETVESVTAQIEALRPQIEAGLSREALQAAMPPGAARNALDCALWDLDAKRSGVRAMQTAGLDRLPVVTTAYTLSLGTPEEMAAAAAKASARPVLKIKLGAGDGGDPDRLRAVRAGAPDAALIVDANEGWGESELEAMLALCAELGVALVEQPLPAGRDGLLGRIARPVPVCADESVHARNSLAGLGGLYDAVNIKLDKTGGLTEALEMARTAEQAGLGIMVGCMLATSLAMAPALLLAPRARFVDLDGPLLLAQDRPDGLSYEGSLVHPPAPALWG